MTTYTPKHAYVHITRVLKDLKSVWDIEYPIKSSTFIHFEPTEDKTVTNK